MKLMAIILTITVFQTVGSVYSQNTTFNFQLKNVPIKNVLQEIENSSEFKFLYRSEFLNVNRKVDIFANNERVETILESMFNSPDITYRIFEDNLIVITNKRMMQMQPRIISGIVNHASTGEALPGVNVVVKGTTIGTITDINGNFRLEVPADAMALLFSFVGMKSQEIIIEDRTIINIQMEEDIVGIEEVVAIGYGIVKRSDLTGSVTRIDSDTYESQAKTQVTDMLAGTVAGLYMQQGSSASGIAPSMEIRGVNSLLAKSNPLIVIDGVIFNGNIENINPNDISTIDVLKDASSAAIYGAKAASGVIIITTSKGQGPPKIGFKTTFGISETTRDIKPFDKNGYLDFRRDLLRESSPKEDYYYFNPNELPGSISIDEWRNYSANPAEDNTMEWLSRLSFWPIEMQNYIEGNTVDWYNKVMQKGIRQTYDINASGGSNDMSYYFSLGHTNNEGIIFGDKYSIFRARLNFDVKVADFINVGLNTQFSNKEEDEIPANLSHMYAVSPYGSNYNDDGTLKLYPHDYTPARNPFLDDYYSDYYYKENSLFSSLYAQLKLPFNISYRLSYQPRFDFVQYLNFRETAHTPAFGTRINTNTYEWIIDNLVKWNKNIGVHNFDLTLLYSAEKNQNWRSVLENTNFMPNEILSYHAISLGSFPFVNSNDMYHTGDAALARLNYTLLDKYLFTASIRRDGFSAFGKSNPRANFPSLAFAWKLHEEDFFNLNWVSQAKLRISWGINGNRDIGIYSALSRMKPSYYYDGSSVAIGIIADNLENHDLRWEKTYSTNFGCDLSFLQNRINLSADYYISTTKDLLMNRSLPIITGFEDMAVNLGEMANHGFEMTLNSVNVSTQKLNWKTNFVFYYNRNEIKKLYGDQGTYIIKGETLTGELPDYSNKWFPGHPLDAVWDYKVQGVWQLDEATDAANVNLKPGDYKVIDLNGDGLYTETEDKQFIGYSKPRYNFGLRNTFTLLKNLSVSVYLRADLGHMGALPQAIHSGSNTYHVLNTRAVPYWTKDNQESVWARLNVINSVYDGGYNVYFSRSFVRIQDLSLTYSLPQEICKRMKLSDLQIFTSVRNLYTFDKWEDFDPETDYRTPMPRTYTFGLNIEL